jgi:hypothetical protein
MAVNSAIRGAVMTLLPRPCIACLACCPIRNAVAESFIMNHGDTPTHAVKLDIKLLLHSPIRENASLFKAMMLRANLH